MMEPSVRWTQRAGSGGVHGDTAEFADSSKGKDVGKGVGVVTGPKLGTSPSREDTCVPPLVYTRRL